MLIRSLAELIVQLHADESGAPAGPVFNLSPKVIKMLEKPTDPIFLDINFHVTNMKSVAHRLEKLIDEHDPPPTLKPKFVYVHQNVQRMVGNLEYIYQNGIYPPFVNSAPPCSDDDSCG
jgi:GMP synthase PP-ATPase subunit